MAIVWPRPKSVGQDFPSRISIWMGMRRAEKAAAAAAVALSAADAPRRDETLPFSWMVFFVL